MKKTLLFSVLILGAVFILAGCVKTSVDSTSGTNDQPINGQTDQDRGSDKTTRDTNNLGGFCGSSTKTQCQTDADCVSGGCSGQICGSANDQGGVSTCEWTDCYDKTKYGVNCGCVAEECQWYN